MAEGEKVLCGGVRRREIEMPPAAARMPKARNAIFRKCEGSGRGMFNAIAHAREQEKSARQPVRCEAFQARRTSRALCERGAQTLSLAHGKRYRY